jgi:vacuolar iron transporter family protein
MSDLLYLDFPEFLFSNLTFAKRPKASSKKQPGRQSSQRPDAMSLGDVPHTLLYTPVAAAEELDSFDSLDLEKESMIRQMSSDSLSSTLGKPDSEAGAKKRFTFDARFISDAIIGLSDGLTVPFALTAGLSALGDSKVVIFGGLAELTAGAISMGLGGYLGAKSEEYGSATCFSP